MSEEPTTASLVVVVGNLNDDLMLLDVPRLPEWGHELLVDRHLVAPAGQAGYLAMALGALGRPVACLSVIGDDERGRAIVSELARHGVDTSQVARVPDLPTGLTVALVRPDGERAFVSDLGASRALDPGIVATSMSAVAAAAAAVAVVGVFNTPALLGEAGEILRRARETGSLTVFDPGWDPMGWSSATRATVLSALEHVDLFLPNLEEAVALTGLSDPQKAAAALSAAGAATVVIKCGIDGSFARAADGTCRQEPAVHVPSGANAVGAGDTYDAALIHALLNGSDLASAMSVASAAAAIYVSRTTDRFPQSDQIRQALPTQIPDTIL